jgi:hypothetical protein
VLNADLFVGAQSGLEPNAGTGFFEHSSVSPKIESAVMIQQEAVALTVFGRR